MSNNYILILLLLSYSLYGADEPTKIQFKEHNVQLTQKELEYIKNNNPINVCYTKRDSPFFIKNKNKFTGLSVDILHLISKKINIQFNMIEAQSIKERQKFIKEKKCLVLPMIMTYNNKNKLIVPTEELGKDHIVLVTKIDQPYISDLSILKNKKIAIQDGTITVENYIKKLYPNIEIVKVKGLGLKKVLDGEVYGAIASSLKMSYLIINNFSSDLKIMGRVGDRKVSGSFGVSKDEPILLDILNKAIDDITPKQKQQVLKSWYSVKIEKGLNPTFILKIAVVILIIFLIVILFLIILKRKVKSEVAKNKQKDEHIFQQSRLAQIGQMTSMIEHQWRQPLTSINSTIINMQLNASNDDFTDEFKEINKYVKYLSSTIDDFRNFYKPTKDKELVDITIPIIDALQIIEKSLKSKGIGVDTNFKTNQKLFLDKNAIMQVMLTIIQNSIDNFKNNNISNPQISIETKKENNKYYITISDNGRGINKNIIDNIFNPYFSTKDKSTHTGIGLYMSKIIVEEHNNGELNVENTKDGVCFSIELN